MSEWTELHLAPPVAANLARLGWQPAHPRVREAAASGARGVHLAVTAPPSPAWAGPALAGVVSRLAAERPGRLLLVCPQEAVAEWGSAVAALAAGTGLQVRAPRGAARAARLLHAAATDILVASPETTLALQARSALPPESVAAVALVWPEQWAQDEVLTPLMQDLPRDSQRCIVGTDPATVAALAERYARKAVPAGPPAPAETHGPVRTVAVAWERRVAAVAEVAELLDPSTLTVWMADRRHQDALAAALAGVAPDATLTTALPEGPAGTIVAFDLPDATTLASLLAAGEVVLLVPAGAELWVPSLAAPRRPLLLPGLLDGLTDEVRRRRRAIADTIAAGDLTEAALTLAPLLERHEAPVVAAALYRLWTLRASEAPAPAVATPATARVWIGAGRRDEVGPNDLVAFLTREVGVDRGMIGRIEIRESFSLVEVPEGEAGRIATAIGGRTLRRRRLAAKVDQGPAAGRPAPRGRPRRD